MPSSSHNLFNMKHASRVASLSLSHPRHLPTRRCSQWVCVQNEDTMTRQQWGATMLLCVQQEMALKCFDMQSQRAQKHGGEWNAIEVVFLMHVGKPAIMPALSFARLERGLPFCHTSKQAGFVCVCTRFLWTQVRTHSQRAAVYTFTKWWIFISRNHWITQSNEKRTCTRNEHVHRVVLSLHSQCTCTKMRVIKYPSPYLFPFSHFGLWSRSIEFKSFWWKKCTAFLFWAILAWIKRQPSKWLQPSKACCCCTWDLFYYFKSNSLLKVLI